MAESSEEKGQWLRADLKSTVSCTEESSENVISYQDK